MKQSIFEASEALQKWEGRLFHWFSSNSEVEATWTSLIGWPHKTSILYLLNLVVHCLKSELRALLRELGHRHLDWKINEKVFILQYLSVHCQIYTVLLFCYIYQYSTQDISLISSIEYMDAEHQKLVGNHQDFSPFISESFCLLKLDKFKYRIVTFDLYFINLNSCRRNYSREETIQGRKLFAEIRYLCRILGQ